MIKSKPKIIASIIILIISLVMLVVGSFAWFTISTNPEISGMQVRLDAPERLLLSVDNETWTESLLLSQQFDNKTPLKPVSTVDGLNWFLPNYDTLGILVPAINFELDDKLEHANVSTVDENGKKLDGSALSNAQDLGYYVYSDFYMKTEEDATQVRLSFYNPFAYTEDSNNHLGTDGTYVLPTYTIEEFKPEASNPNSVVVSKKDYSDADDRAGVNETDTKKYSVTNVSNEAERSIRIGLLIEPDYTGTPLENNTEKNPGKPLFSDTYASLINKFVIFEPNADNRTSIYKPGSKEYKEQHDDVYSYETDRYVLNYDYIDRSDPDFNYLDGHYYETLPIANLSTADNKLYEPVRITDGRFNNTMLISQKSFRWNMNALIPNMIEAYESGAIEAGLPWWNSYDIDFYNAETGKPDGAFLDTNYLYNGQNIYSKAIPDTVIRTLPKLELNDKYHGTGAGLSLDNITVQDSGSVEGDTFVVYPYEKTENYASDIIMTLYKEKPVRIRMFVWIEGQDIDCWNDIASGGFVVNLEFGGFTA